MATAPTPGAARRSKEQSRVLRMTIHGKTLEFQPSAITLAERFNIRNATTLPFEAFFGGEEGRLFGSDSIAVLWWLARRHNGEPALSWQEFASGWTDDPDFDVEAIEDDDPEDDRPEGSGSGSSTDSLT